MTYDVLLENESIVEVASPDRGMSEGDRVGVGIAREPIALVEA
jgi:hypothetical protein